MPRPLPSLAFSAALMLGTQAMAQPAAPAPPTQAQRAAESQAAERAGFAAAVKGPSTVALADQAELHLPARHVWIPPREAARMLRAWGNQPSSQLLGLVAGVTAGHDWIATVSFTGEGYVKDGDAQDIDPSKLLATMRENADAEAEDRRARGFPAMVIGNWLQKPRYDSGTKRLVWALPLYDAGEDPDQATINYNTRALGRNGYLSLNLLTDKAHFAAEQPEAEALLGDLAYLPGKRYADFQPSSDRVAEYGVAALIGAVALKKLGIIALGTAVVVKFAKVGILAVLAAGAAVRRFFGRRDKGQGSV